MLYLPDARRHVNDYSSRFDARIRAGSTRTVLHLAGEVDLAKDAEIRAALDCAIDLGARTVVIDLSRVTFIDAYGIGLIVGAWRSALERGVTFGVSGVEGQVAHMFALVGLEGLVVNAADAGDPKGDVDGRR